MKVDLCLVCGNVERFSDDPRYVMHQVHIASEDCRWCRGRAGLHHAFKREHVRVLPFAVRAAKAR